MVMTPVVETLATAEPETMPMSADDITAALAGPPEDLFENFMPMSMSSCPPPQVLKNTPKTMK